MTLFGFSVVRLRLVVVARRCSSLLVVRCCPSLIVVVRCVDWFSVVVRCSLSCFVVVRCGLLFVVILGSPTARPETPLTSLSLAGYLVGIFQIQTYD